MKEQGPKPHTTSTEGCLSSRTDWTHQNPVLHSSSSGHWTHCCGASEQISAPGREMIHYGILQRGAGTGPTIRILQRNQAWKKPSVQTRPVARITEKHTGSSLWQPFPLLFPYREPLKRLLGKGRIVLSLHITLVWECIEVVCHNPSLSTSSGLVLSTSASHQMFW